MPNAKLPERASLEYLKKLAKDRLKELRLSDPLAKLTTALLAIARDHGFSSWRALKAEIDQRQAQTAALFFEACTNGDMDVLHGLLAHDGNLVRAEKPDAPYRGWTGLHEAAKRGRVDVIRLLLAYGADPNARETGDNTYALHWAAAQGHIESVRALLDGGGDVHGVGDAHELTVIGWATYYDTYGRASGDNLRVVSLLVERGASHHIFSAIAVGDLNLIQKVVEQNPEALDRRLSHFEQGQTALQFAMSRSRYDIMDLLVELGADLEATDKDGQTALEVAMLRGDREAMRRLQVAGAEQPKPVEVPNFTARMARMAESTEKIVPMISVPDVARSLEWYTSIGFKECGRYGDQGAVNWGMVSFGKAELMLVPKLFLGSPGKAGPHDASLWFYTNQVDHLYQILKSRQLQAAQTTLAGGPGGDQGIEFAEDLNAPFYGGKQFGIRDPNGYILYFLQSADS